uniref:Synaptopodin 2 n=1 Tax=Gasterosteus aculeatus TaxID=69293 RepID=G3Q7G1_GASAC
MGTGDYICVTLRGGAPWGFSLREGEGDTSRPFLVSQVEEGSRAFLAGVREGDEVVSLNGEPCANLLLSQAFTLIDTSIDCLQLLVKRSGLIYSTTPPGEAESEETDCGGRDSTDETLKSTTLHIFTARHGSQSPRDEAYYGELGIDTEVPKGPKLLYTELHVPSSGNGRGRGHDFQENDGEGLQRFSPGAVVEFQVSLSNQTLDDVGFTSLGSAHGIDGELSNKEAVEMIRPDTASHPVQCPLRQPLGQHGVVLGSPSKLGQVELILQQPAASGAGRGLPSVGGPGVGGSVGSHSEGEEGGGQCEGVPGSFTVSFEIPSEEATAAEEHGSDSEGDQDKPNKHRARHARLRRSESLSEKHVKEVKSKCKRIALLLTAAPPNPNNKGVLMFKKHRQRAKKYTLVSYGTGEDEPEYSDEEDEENEIENQETHAVEFTLVAPNGSKIDKHFLTNAHSTKGVLTINWDNSLLEIERKLNNQAQMECLPETKGKGASMFAQRRQRMDEISAEHDELRRQGIPVEAVSVVKEKREDHSYTQSTTEGHAYMDVNTHQQGQQQQNYQQYQERQYYEQQQNYNRTAKPFSVENIPATPYSPAMSRANQDIVSQGEQIASRDERISTPASRTGLLSDSRRRNAGKPMFTFKEAPKVSPNPALLNLLNRKDKKGFESGPEEDYLSLGAEACNFLQSQQIKHKTPPPVAPKPVINPNSPPWSPQPQHQQQPSINAWPPSKTQDQVQPPWIQAAQPQPPAQPQAILNPWLPVPAQAQSPPSWAQQPRVSPPINPMATVLNPSSQGSAFEMPAVRGKGADMFAKRQSRMEKFVVDSETVQANKTSRPESPAASLPNEWKYTPNVRAPPSRGYNPILSPSYPPAATKQPPTSSPSTKANKKGKDPSSVLEVMKHQPYQLNASLLYFQPPGGPYQQAYNQQTYQQPAPPAYHPQAPHSPNPPYQHAPQALYQPANSPPYLTPPSVSYQPQAPSVYVAPSFPIAARPESAAGGNTAAAPKPRFTAKKSSAQVWKPTAVDK